MSDRVAGRSQARSLLCDECVETAAGFVGCHPPERFLQELLLPHVDLQKSCCMADVYDDALMRSWCLKCCCSMASIRRDRRLIRYPTAHVRILPITSAAASAPFRVHLFYFFVVDGILPAAVSADRRLARSLPGNHRSPYYFRRPSKVPEGLLPCTSWALPHHWSVFAGLSLRYTYHNCGGRQAEFIRCERTNLAQIGRLGQYVGHICLAAFRL